MSMNHVIDQLDRRSNSRQNLLIVDACRNNPAKGKSAGVTGSTAVNLPQGISMLFAAKSGQKSWESTDESIQHGVMTHFLLKGLRGDAMNRRSQLIWSRLVSHVREEVEFDAGKLAGGPDRRQTPHTIANNDSVIVLNEPAVPHLIIGNWVQFDRDAYSVDRFDVNVRYIIEFWPSLTDEISERFIKHAKDLSLTCFQDLQTQEVQYITVIADTRANVEKLLLRKLSTSSKTTVAEAISRVAVAADTSGSITSRYIGKFDPVDQPHVLFLGQSQSRTWRGTWNEFDMEDQLAVDTIGSLPPELSVDHWYTDGDGQFRKDAGFRHGNIYVIEFWATWCAPCHPAMGLMARLQGKYHADDVRFISVSHENPDVINKFLDREVTDEFLEQIKSQGIPKTYREAFQHYSVTSKDDWNRFWVGMGQEGIPFCFVIGRTGLIEWLGHTLAVEKPLQKIVSGNWDREKYRLEYSNKRDAASFFKRLDKAGEAGGDDLALEMVNKKLRTVTDDEWHIQLIYVKHMLSMQLGTVSDECLQYFQTKLSEWKIEKDPISIMNFSGLVNVTDPRSENALTLAQSALSALQANIDEVPKERMFDIHLMIAKLYLELNKTDLANVAFAKGLNHAPEELKESIQETYDKLVERKAAP